MDPAPGRAPRDLPTAPLPLGSPRLSAQACSKAPGPHARPGAAARRQPPPAFPSAPGGPSSPLLLQPHAKGSSDGSNPGAAEGAGLPRAPFCFEGFFKLRFICWVAAAGRHFSVWGLTGLGLCHLLLNAKQLQNLFTLITEFYSAKIPVLKHKCRSYANHRRTYTAIRPQRSVRKQGSSPAAPWLRAMPGTPRVLMSGSPCPCKRPRRCPTGSDQEVRQDAGQALPAHLRRDEFHPAKASAPRHS